LPRFQGGPCTTWLAPGYARFLTIRVTNVSLVVGNAPVTSQQPSVGKSTPLAWKPVSLYPSGTNPRAGGAGRPAAGR
jgi:hypothetical protein